jgi:CheY-like chemotaxis protein
MLLLDDDPDVRETLRDVLTEHGMDVDTAATAHGAVEMLRSKRYDVALFDIMLESSMTGLDVAREVIRRAPPPMPPLVLITAYDPEAVAEMLNFPPELSRVMFRGRPPIVIHKPPRIEDILDAVRRVMA